jgi:hypothetical protein
MTGLPISPLSLDALTRDTWGSYDAYAIAQLAPLAYESCYQPKFYKAPDLASELFAPYAYVNFGLKITPGSLVYGIYLPADPNTNVPPPFSLQVTDAALNHKWWDEPIPSYFVGNYKATYLDTNKFQIGSFPNLFDAPYPIVGEGLLSVEIWETSGNQQRIEVVFGVLEVVG